MKKKLKGFADMSSTVKSLLLVAVLAVQGVSASWVSANFVRKGPVLTADATAFNIVGTQKSGQVALNVQQRTGANVDAFKVYANGGYRFQIDSNGTAVLGGAQAWKRDAITPTTTPGTTIPVARHILAVADAVTASRHLQLQAANAVAAGYTILVVDTPATAATGNITINRAGSDTITTTTTGNTSCTIATNGGAAYFISDGASVWKRILLAG